MIIPAAQQSRPVALVGATIHPVTGGVIQNGTIVFDKAPVAEQLLSEVWQRVTGDEPSGVWRGGNR